MVTAAIFNRRFSSSSRGGEWLEKNHIHHLASELWYSFVQLGASELSFSLQDDLRVFDTHCAGLHGICLCE